MKIYKTHKGIIINHENKFFLSQELDWDVFANRGNLFHKIVTEINNLKANDTLSAIIEIDLLAPIGKQEVWASGVTYLRSREARWKNRRMLGEVIFMHGFITQNALSFFLNLLLTEQ
jgi:2-dehydro-3-deoxy-D-arabinonate dehydratase